MTVPSAIVRVRIVRLLGIPAAMLQGTQRVYAMARVAGRALGRSRLVSAAGDFDLGPEAAPWVVEAPVSGSDTVDVSVELWDDRGDLAPQRLAQMTDSVPARWTPGTRTFGGTPQCEIEVARRALPPQQARATVPPNRAGQRAQATVRARPAVVLEFTDIRGLCQPGYRPSSVAHPKRSEPRPGYRSEDHLGRVFLNRDLNGGYRRNTQLIEVTVAVRAQRGAIPSDAKVRWTVVDPDDEFDNSPSVHREWAAYIDERDYPGGNPAGAHPNDNEGTPDQSTRWEAVGGHALTVISPTVADTTIQAQQSQVRIHAPNVAGDNFIVRATLEPATNVDVLEAETGIMTMFHRIDVEYRKMRSALDIPVQNISPLFEQARAELNFETGPELTDQDPLATSHASLSAEASAYLNSHFTHARDGGWFLLLAAMLPFPLPAGGSRGRVLFRGNVALQRGGAGANAHEFFDVLGDHADADFVRLSGGGVRVGFGVHSAVPFRDGGVQKTRIRIQPHDIQPEFTAGDGSLAHAYRTRLWFFPRGRREGATWTPPGYGLPATVRAVVQAPGASYTSGVSPPETAGGRQFFAGRTVAFTHHGAYRDEGTGLPKPGYGRDIVQTLAHEFVHAFGMPHKCGYYDYLTPRDRTCHLNYWNNWMLDTARQLIAGSDDRMGDNMCGRHLKEVRRVHLEDNGGLRALGW